jgi:hypothetical protein
MNTLDARSLRRVFSNQFQLTANSGLKPVALDRVSAS